MLSLKTIPTSLHLPKSPFKSLRCSSLPLHITTNNMSSSSSLHTTTIEHIVLFKLRDSTDPTLVNSMLTNLRSLTSLNLATHLSAGPILRLRSSAATSLSFTHLLHARYPSKQALNDYANHPSHVSVVKQNILPICDDIMAVDWVFNSQLPAPSPGNAMRVTLVKPKAEAGTKEIVEVIGGSKGAVKELSFGENFSPARAKGYTVGFVAVFDGVEEMDRAGESGELEAQKEKVRGLIESVVVVDYVVPGPTAASL